jgi:hypothetical protein
LSKISKLKKSSVKIKISNLNNYSTIVVEIIKVLQYPLGDEALIWANR